MVVVHVRDQHDVSLGVAAQVCRVRNSSEERRTAPQHRIGDDTRPFDLKQHRRVTQKGQMLWCGHLLSVPDVASSSGD